MMEKYIGKKDKWTNKGNDKPYVADSLIHRTTCHNRSLCQTGLMVRASDFGSGDPGSILGRVGVLFP